MQTDPIQASNTPPAAPEARAFRLKADILKSLSARTNGPGLRRALGHFGAIALVSTLLWQLRGSFWVIPLIGLQGYLLAFLFTAEHETAHHTAFRSRFLNYIVGHLSGLIILLPYEYYRAFHWDHHRYTQDHDRDPELQLRVPSDRLGVVLFWSGLPIWVNRVKLLWRHGVLGSVNVPWVSDDKKALIVREARFYVLAYLGILLASIATGSPAALLLWIVPVIVGQWFLRPYQLAEHTGCDHSKNMLHNSRTTYTNAFVRYFAWNMPYHAEHHAYPAVPFHALPQLHTHTKVHIKYKGDGYVTATAGVVKKLRQGARDARNAAESSCSR